MQYEPLSTIKLEADNRLSQPEDLPELVHLDDHALAVMIDFKQTKPITVKAGEFIDHTLNEMKVSGVHLLIVIDDEERVVGLIGSEDLLGEKPLKVMQKRRMPRNEIRVRLIMAPQTELSALDIDELRHAKVAHIIETMRKLKSHYILVTKTVTKTNEKTELQHVVGLFASSQINKQLHMDITDSLRAARSIAELQERERHT